MIQERIATLRKEGPPETFDNTMLSSFSKCQWAFILFMSGLEHLNPPPYFTWGRAFGAALNSWHSTQDSGENNKTRFFRARKTAEDLWISEAPIVPEKDDNSKDNLIQTLYEYTQVYGAGEPWKMPYGKGELGFQFPIPGTLINYAGSIDAPIEWNPYGLLFREDKTTGAYLTDSYIKQWDFSSQVTGYSWAFDQLLGEPPFGAYMNMISKKRRKDVQDKFSRYLTKRDPHQIDRFISETVRVVNNLREVWETWSWSKTGNRDPINCTGGMGRSPCLYRRLCLMEADPWDLEGFEFEEFSLRDRWAPWERDGEDS
jgi:hypothetical protein